ncbi:MAG TPA: hypothetical protein VIP78_14565 [Candidatus Dormibacteraeota bacterium]
MDELGQDRAQVALAEGYQVVEALAADGPHPALRNRVRAGRLNRRPQTLDAQPGGALAEVGAPDPVAIVNQVVRLAVPG